MQVKIHVREEELDNLAKFLLAPIPYEHTVEYFLHAQETPTVEILLNMRDYVILRDFDMNKNFWERNK